MLAGCAAAGAGACSDMKKAAITLASVGAATAGMALGSRKGDGLLWRPNGLLSGQDTSAIHSALELAQPEQLWVVGKLSPDRLESVTASL